MSDLQSASQIQIPAFDGGAFSAYVAMPDITPAPAVIMIQEIFGINKEMRDKCDEIARQGYIAIAPDLFWRIEPGIELLDSDEAQLRRAFELFDEFDVQIGLEDLKTTMGYLRNHKECSGKVGSVGYCLGGFLAVALSVESDIDATVSYYGVNIPSILEHISHMKNPMLLHIAEEDEFVPPEDQQKIVEAFSDKNHIETHIYEGQNHAFARGGGMHYNEEAATLANKRTKEFLSKSLK